MCFLLVREYSLQHWDVFWNACRLVETVGRQCCPRCRSKCVVDFFYILMKRDKLRLSLKAHTYQEFFSWYEGCVQDNVRHLHGTRWMLANDPCTTCTCTVGLHLLASCFWDHQCYSSNIISSLSIGGSGSVWEWAL